jgi:hypothetical protein
MLCTQYFLPKKKEVNKKIKKVFKKIKENKVKRLPLPS